MYILVSKDIYFKSVTPNPIGMGFIQTTFKADEAHKFEKQSKYFRNHLNILTNKVYIWEKLTMKDNKLENRILDAIITDIPALNGKLVFYKKYGNVYTYVLFDHEIKLRVKANDLTRVEFKPVTTWIKLTRKELYNYILGIYNVQLISLNE